MKTALTHLPQNKQEELTELTEIIIENVPAEMIILFGSHARATGSRIFSSTLSM